MPESYSFKEGQEVVATVRGRIIRVIDNRTLFVRSGECDHRINTEEAESVTVIRQAADFAVSSVIWVSVKGEPGTERVTVVLGYDGVIKLFRATDHPAIRTLAEIESVTGVDYEAPEYASPF